MKNCLILTAIVMALGLTGCMTSRLPEVSETMVTPGYLPTPQVPRHGVAVGKQSQPYQQSSNLQRYSLAMVDMDLREALAALSRLSSAPIVAEPEVTGTVNIVVENKTVAEILMAMIRPLGYSARVDNGVIVVGKPGMVTRAFHLNYLKDKRTFSSITNASISSTSSSEGGSGTSEGNVKVTTTGGSDFWKELITGLEMLVFGGKNKDSGASGKKIVVNEMAGVVYVTDTEEGMEIVSAFLEDVDKELKRQVMIQAHIVEVDLDKEFSLGIDWSDIFNSGKASVAQNLISTSAAGVFTLNINTGDFSLMLDAFKEQGNVNMLSSPKISTMNNQKAVIKLTTKEVTWVNNTTFNSTGDVLTTSTTPQIDEVGLFLDVTPNINESGAITMQVHPNISEIKSVSLSPDGTSSKPVVTVREVDTVVDVMSGQTVVIAGLIADRTREVKRSVPLLGDIPFIGLAFSNFQQEHRKTELVIFLTPFVLEDQSIDEIRKQHEYGLRSLDEISHFIESRPWGDAGDRRTTDNDMVEPATEVVPDATLQEALPQSESLPLGKGEIVFLETENVLPEVTPASDTGQWVTPPPRRVDGN